MATGVEELLEMLYDMIDEAKGVPLNSDKCMLDRDKALDILDEVRSQFPVEFAESRKLLATRNDYLASAKREAELIRKQAEDQAKMRLGETEVMTEAKRKAAEMLHQAEDQSRDLRKAANAYCVDLLQRAGAALADAGKELNQSKTAFLNLTGGSAPAGDFDVEE